MWDMILMITIKNGTNRPSNKLSIIEVDPSVCSKQMLREIIHQIEDKILQAALNYPIGWPSVAWIKE